LSHQGEPDSFKKLSPLDNIRNAELGIRYPRNQGSVVTLTNWCVQTQVSAKDGLREHPNQQLGFLPRI
jgi:hypothetical protein